MATTIPQNNFYFGPAFGRILNRANKLANNVYNSCVSPSGPKEKPVSQMLTIGGAITAGVGVLSSLIGRNSTLVKTGGIILGLLGAAVLAISKILGNELDILSALQKSIIGSSDVKTKPEDLGLKADPVSIKTNDGEELTGHFIHSPKPTNKTIIYIHGVRSCGSKCLDEIRKIQGNVPVNVLVVDPRGFGNSTLKNKLITTEGLITDGKAMYDYLVNVKGIKPEDISVFGHSLGGAIAVGLAKERKVDNLILQSTFTKTSQCAENALKKLLPDMMAATMGKLLNTDFNSAEDIKQVQANNLVIFHGEKDLITPSCEGKELYDLSEQNPNLKSRSWVPQKNADHTDYYDHYTEQDFDFINSLFSKKEEESSRADSPIPITAVIHDGTASMPFFKVAA